MSLYNKYVKYILNPNPSISWKILRYVLHWITLPFKVLFIGSLGIYQIIKNSFSKTRAIPELPSLEIKKQYFNLVYSALPVYKDEHRELYLPRNPFDKSNNGSNHNTDHQCLRQGTYSFIMQRLFNNNYKIENSLDLHMQQKWLLRGYTFDSSGITMYNAHSTSGDMLIGLSLGLLNSTSDISRDKFDNLIHTILENDFSLLEGDDPKNGPEGELYQELLKLNHGVPEKVKMKSIKGMWQPGIETVGAQAVTILAALRLADKKYKFPEAKKAYKKLLYLYGYGILSLFPTAYIDRNRGYFNDHNVLQALYILSKLANNKFTRFFWKIPMYYTFLLSRHWYNGYFAGLLQDAHQGTVSQKYIDTCLSFLYEKEPNTFCYEIYNEESTSEIPVNINDLPSSEFENEISRNIKRINSQNKIKSGLGFISAAVMLEKDPKILL